MKYYYLNLLIVVILLHTGSSKGQLASDSPYRFHQVVPQKMEWLPFGEVRPAGWIKTRMQGDLNGFVGHLDQLVPDLMADSIYGSARLTRAVKSKSVGNIGIELDPQYLWWNSETQSNWRDGFIRNAILLDDKENLVKVRQYINYILSTQDKDGYLGIYSQDLRYNFADENGELWSKTTLLRGLLAWYEYTGDKKVFRAVEKAVKNVMEHYPVYHSSPFKSVKPFAGGLTHGLVFTDILDRMYQLTGKQIYLEYALFLYQDFSENTLNEDAQYLKTLDPAYKLKEHGVHTYEHLRPLSVAWIASGNPEMERALKSYQSKIQSCITPAGGPIGDEWVAGRTADASTTGYEYCSIHELMDGYCNLLQKTGDVQYGDMTERIFFNAAQGARHPEKSCIAYCKTDNSYSMTGTINGQSEPEHQQTRFKYSPAHQDVAVCCVPNAGRISPYFVKSMWMKDREGLIATLPGPCRVETTINNQKVTIEENTDYPFRFSFQFNISVEKPVHFKLKIRKPGWGSRYKIDCEHTEENGYIVISRQWNGMITIHLDYYPEPEVKQLPGNGYYFTCGPLVFALPVKDREFISRTFPVKGFNDYKYSPVNLVKYQYQLQPEAGNISAEPLTAENPWHSLTLRTNLINGNTGKAELVTLEPLGGTILRQVTFNQPMHLSSGWVRRLENFQSKYVEAKNIDVWMPEGYDPGKHYAVLYMHDGQMLFDSATTWNKQEWGVDETVGRLIRDHKIRDCIVVGIWNHPLKRHIEYFPQKALDYLSPSEKEAVYKATRPGLTTKLLEGGPVSDNYLRFLVTELKPFIDSTFATLPEQESTFIGGSSMGGLISLYAMCEYPDVFGGAACLSTHWPGTFETVSNPVPGAFLAYLKDHLPPPGHHKIYFDYGTVTLDSLYKPFQQKADIIVKEKGYTSQNWMTREFPGEDHSERAWRKRLSIPIEFILGL